MAPERRLFLCGCFESSAKLLLVTNDRATYFPWTPRPGLTANFPAWEPDALNPFRP